MLSKFKYIVSIANNFIKFSVDSFSFSFQGTPLFHLNFVKFSFLDPGRGRFRIIWTGRRSLMGSGTADKGDDKNGKLTTIGWVENEVEVVYNWRAGELMMRCSNLSMHV